LWLKLIFDLSKYNADLPDTSLTTRSVNPSSATQREPYSPATDFAGQTCTVCIKSSKVYWDFSPTAEIENI